jgi:hypothetical protein
VLRDRLARSRGRWHDRDTCRQQGGLRRPETAQLTAGQRLHPFGRVEDLLGAIQTYLICLRVNGEWARQIPMAATEDSFKDKSNGVAYPAHMAAPPLRAVTVPINVAETWYRAFVRCRP